MNSSLYVTRETKATHSRYLTNKRPPAVRHSKLPVTPKRKTKAPSSPSSNNAIPPPKALQAPCDIDTMPEIDLGFLRRHAFPAGDTQDAHPAGVVQAVEEFGRDEEVLGSSAFVVGC